MSNTSRNDDNPSLTPKAADLLGIHFNPQGPIGDPLDFEGLDFGDLDPPAPPTPPAAAPSASEPAAAVL